MSIEVGSKLQGKVTGITNFGAFVELPEGSTGLVHISEVADNYVKDINDHLKVGDIVEVKVINLKRMGKLAYLSKRPKIARKDSNQDNQRIHNVHHAKIEEMTVLKIFDLRTVSVQRKTLRQKWQNF